MAKKTKRKKRARPKAKRRVYRRRKTRARKKPVRRKARRNPVRRKTRKVARRKPVRKARRKARKTYRKARKTYARKPARRKPVRRRKARRNPRKMKKGLNAFLPNMKEFQNVLVTGAQVMGGWAACAAAAQLVSPGVAKLYAAMNIPAQDEDGKMPTSAFWMWQGVDVLLAFAVGGLAGQFFGSKVRNTVLLGGVMRVVWHVGQRYIPPEAQKYVIGDAPGMGDWITAADVGALPAPALGDYITSRNMPVGAYGGAY